MSSEEQLEMLVEAKAKIVSGLVDLSASIGYDPVLYNLLVVPIAAIVDPREFSGTVPAAYGLREFEQELKGERSQ